MERVDGLGLDGGVPVHEVVVLLRCGPPEPCCITRDTMVCMADVSIRDLRNHGGDVVDRVERGESFVVTRSGKPVAELRPLGPQGLPVAELIRRRANLPVVDPESLRRDIDAAIDPSL